MHVRSLLSITALLLLTAFRSTYAQGDQAFPHPQAEVRIITSDVSSVILEVNQLKPVLDSEGFLVHNARRYLFREEFNALPELHFRLAVPTNAGSLRVSVQKNGENVEGLGSQGVVNGLTSQQREEIEILGESRLRSLRTVFIVWRPFRLQGRSLIWSPEATIKLEWDATGDMEKGEGMIAEEIPVIEEELRKSVLNYDQVRSLPGFSTSTQRTLLSRADSDWGLGEEALILLVPETGIYTLSIKELVAAGLPSGVNINDLRLRNREEFVEILVYDNGIKNVLDAEDVLEFLGVRNPGEPGIYFNEITDTNAYVLTWSGGEGNPPVIVQSKQNQYDNVIESYDSTIHIEKEEFWFGGLTLPKYLDGDVRTLHTTERVPHERFYWRKSRLTIQNPLTFDCSPVYGPGLRTTMDVRVAGITYVDVAKGSVSPPQEMTFILNGITIGTASIRDTADTTVSFSFPSNFLINGTNKLIVRLIPHDIIENEVIIDYLELEGRWYAMAENHSLVVPATPALHTGLSIVGLPGPDVGLPGPDVRSIVSGETYRADSVERGYLFRLSSRAGTALRGFPGFYAKVGEEQAVADAPGRVGVMVVEVEPNSEGGRILRREHFKTGESFDGCDAFDKAAAILDEVEDSNIVLAGLAFATGCKEKSEAFIQAFKGLGSRVVSEKDLFAGAWVFAARKGDPNSAVEKFVADDQGITANLFIPDPNGNRWRAVAPISGGNGEEVTISTLLEPRIRHHNGDQLIETTNQADLIIITHSAFASEAERLASHRRSHDGYSVVVVDIERIYDEFNDGVKDPVAIRRFLQYADTNWAEPKPAFVTLFGDASWDSQQRMLGSIMIDYIPSFGVPSTDQLYVVAFGDTTLSPRQFIGRLPATSSADAQAIVDKLIEYDLQPPARWNKRFVFATGGKDTIERDRLRSDALRLAGKVTGSPLQGEAIVISRSGQTDSDLGLPSTVDGDTVRREVNRGAVSFDFNGHGATTNIDLNFGYPEDFDNEGRYFIFSTWSCQTGLYSYPREALRNERFVTIPGKGAIASIGATSYSFTNVDFRIREGIYSRFADPDGDVRLGPLFALAKHDMFASYSFGSYGPHSRTHMLMYNLLGDPSMRIPIRRTPELAIPGESAVILNEQNKEPELGDTLLLVRAALWNYGRPLTGIPFDSGVVVRATLIDPLGEQTSVELKISRLVRFDSIHATLPIGTTPGEYVVRLEADPEGVVEETWLEDNTLRLLFLPRGSQPLPLEPLPYGVVEAYDDITIRLLNPASGPGAKFTLDTVLKFNSPALISSDQHGKVELQELTTTWEFSVPSQLRDATQFWWKAISTSGDPDLAERFPLVESFTVERGNPDVVEVSGFYQMETTRLVDLVNTPQGVGPGTRAVPIYLYAVGQTRVDSIVPSLELDGKRITVRIGSIDYRKGNVTGLSVIVLPPNDVVPLIDTVFNFDKVRIADFEDLVDNHIEPGQRVLLGTSGISFFFGADGLEEIRPVLKMLGSRVADTLTFLDYEGSYALIGGKGVPPDQVKEAWLPARPLRREGKIPPFPVELFDTITAIPRAGVWKSPTFGPATAFRQATFSLDPVSSESLDVVVLGVHRDGIRDTLITQIISSDLKSIDLRSIDALEYPRVEVLAGFTADTLQRLQSVSVELDPSPELAIVPSTVRLSPDSILQGDPVAFEATVMNLTSFQSATNVQFQVDELGELGGIIDSGIIDEIAPLNSAQVKLAINTNRFRSNRVYRLLVNSDDRPGEPYTYNNRRGPLPLKVVTDGIPPGFALYADDNRLIDGDFVSPRPTLEARVFDNSVLALDSIQAVTMVLDNQWITVKEGGILESFVKGDYRASFRYTPPEPLAEGPHDLLVFIKDASGNGDTSEIITFFVEPDVSLRTVANWPNPFAKKTTFTFMITGEAPPESGEIAIFTPSGRKIKTIYLGQRDLSAGDLSIGHNTVEWDGLDADGDRLANGVYFYRLKVSAAGKTTEVIEKLVVLR